jgi:cellulose 1,4-beta-cellobiosidase
MRMLFIYFMLVLAECQHLGKGQVENHPKQSWKRCFNASECEVVNGEVTVDAQWRWLHLLDSYTNCFNGNEWRNDACNSSINYTDSCAIEGADYRFLGVSTNGDSLTVKFRTYFDFSTNIGPRLYLMESATKYQMFTLLNNEIAFDVDLSTVECGTNSALYFVAMDADGGMTRNTTNKAGAKYGTGYCDSQCPRNLKFVAGKV